MNDNQQPLPTSSSSHDVVSTLIAHDVYIVNLMKNSPYAHLSYMDRDDLVQEVRLKALGALYEKDIRNLRAYLKTITHNEYISHIRRQKPVLPLSLTDEGEIQGYHSNWTSAVRQGFGDPQVELEEASNFHAQLEVVVRLIVTLPKAQKRAAVCVLRDRIDDPTLLAEVFKQHNLDISTLQWPIDADAKRRLQASYAPVRQKLAQIMNVDLTLFKARGTSKEKQAMRSQNAKYHTCPRCKAQAIVLVNVDNNARFYRDDMGNVQYQCINAKCRTTFSVDRNGNIVAIKLGF